MVSHTNIELASKKLDEAATAETPKEAAKKTEEEERIAKERQAPRKGEAPEEPKKATLSLVGLFLVLRPFFYPGKGTDGYVINRIRAASTWIMVCLSKVASLYSPIFLSQATNDLVSMDFYNASRSITAFIGLRFAASFLKELQNMLYVKVKQQAAIELSENTFKHLHNLSLNWHLSKKTGSVMKSLDRGTEAANNLITYMFLYLFPALAECVAVIILFFASYRQYALGLIVFGGVTLYCFLTIQITQWRKQFRESQNKSDNDFHDKATDSLINYETVKYFTSEDHEIERFAEGVKKFQQYNSMISLSLSFLNISQQLVLMLTMVGCMLVSASAVTTGQMTLGGWVAVQSWVTQIFVPLNFLGSVYAMIFQSFIDITNLSEMLAEQPDLVDEPGAVAIPLGRTEKKGGASDKKDSDISISFCGVSFNYPSQPVEKGLKSVSFHVAPGTTTAFVGHTGAGKTTISRLLFRFYDPSSGQVKLNEFDISKFKQRSVRDLIGIIPQDTVLFNDTILYNIQYGRRDATFEEVEEAARQAQIYDFILSLPEGWNTTVGERGLKLSGGEKQRVAIARCLLKNPPIIILDEATSALDTLTENSVQLALNELGNKKTVVVIAHRLSTIKHADQIVVLDNGIVIECGTHDELLKDANSHYSQLWNMQIKSNTEGTL